MKQLKHPLLFLLAGLGLASCKKSNPSITPLASLNVVNASVNLGTVKANFTGTGSTNYWTQITTSVGYGANNVYGVLANTTVPLRIAATDTTKPVYTANLSLTNGGIYSLFLVGQSTAVDTVMIKESIPYYSDSSCGVRFINLSYNSNPIIVTQSATPTVVDFSSLNYKQYSGFKTYPAKSANASYIFQVRDAGSNAILATYTLSTPYFHNVTLAWIGQTGGTGSIAPKIQRINHY